MTITSLSSIRTFLKTLESKKSDALKGSFEIQPLIQILAKHGWYQIDEKSMNIRERTDHELMSIPASYFTHKNKQRRSVAKYQQPSSFIAIDHGVTEIWYASERTTIMHFECYLHYHLMTFIKKEKKQNNDLITLPLIEL